MPCEDTLIEIYSPLNNSNLVAPSIATHIVDLPSSGFFNYIVTFSGRISGLNDNECGAKGVSERAGTLA